MTLKTSPKDDSKRIPLSFMMVLYLQFCFFIIATPKDASSKMTMPPVYHLLMTSVDSNQKIFIIGDSTVHRHTTDYLAGITDCGDDNPDGTTFEGWGDELNQFMVHPDNCFNNARQGANTETYKKAPGDENLGKTRNWEVTRQKIEEAGGGIVLIQFGSSNENSLADTQAERELIFKNNLRFYINEARELNALPILVTPPEGRDDGIDAPADGSHPNTRGLYPGYIKEIAAETGTSLLDLHQKSNNEFAKYSDKVLLQEFGDCYYSTSGTTDRVHYEPHGAKKVAGWVKELACTTLSDKSLCAQFKAPVDRVIPEINLTGQYTIILAPNQPFIDPGATAFDDRDGDITGNIEMHGIVYTDDAGEYPITYDVQDASGNHAIQLTRTVKATTGMTIREDAQDGNTVNWNVYSGDGNSNDNITNVYDRDRHSRVIEFTGENGLNDGFRYFENQDWNTPSETVISWSMKYSEEFTFFVSVIIGDGSSRIFEYRPINTDMELTDNGRFRFGLGADVIDGKWHTFTRDLAADMHALAPDITINHIIRIAIRGTGSVDDITTAQRSGRSNFVFNGHQYEIVKTALTWQEAADDAAAKGGYLANIGSIAENHAIYSRLFRYISDAEYGFTEASNGGGAPYIWLGGSDLVTEGEWLWTNNNQQFWQGTLAGNNVNNLFTNWGRSRDHTQHEPDDAGGQDALGIALTRWPQGSGSLGQASQWNDLKAGDQLYYIIEYE